MKKRTLEEYLSNHEKSILNLGCGKTNSEDAFGLDIVDNVGVDIVANAEEVFPFEDNTFNHVYARDVLEHVHMVKRIHIMEQIYRVLKPGGILEFLVPSTDWNNAGAFQDPTHYSFWCELSFRYYYSDQVQGSFRSLYDINCHFIPLDIRTFNNDWNITYVGGYLQKPELKKD